LQVDRAYFAPARHPVTHAAVLAWVWMIVAFTPMGATLHALTHLRPLLHASASASAGAHGAEGQSHIAAADEHHGAPHRAPTHCQGCDAWQFFDHVLPVAGPGVPPSNDAGLPYTTAGTLRASIETPWILPRAPPSRA
jgi:hypothetical protein